MSEENVYFSQLYTSTPWVCHSTYLEVHNERVGKYEDGDHYECWYGPSSECHYFGNECSSPSCSRDGMAHFTNETNTEQLLKFTNHSIKCIYLCLCQTYYSISQTW